MNQDFQNEEDVIRDVCLMAKDMWVYDQQRHKVLVAWENLDDLTHQALAIRAAKAIGLEGKQWRNLLDHFRSPGQTMLEVCRKAKASNSTHL